MRHGKPVILLTGPTGVVGRAIIEDLAEDHDIVCVRHRTPIDDPRVREVTGDLTAPSLGLAADEIGQLADEVDLVVHAGAVTKWTARPERIAAANVEGTSNVLQLADRLQRPFVHVSTAFVARPPTQPGPGEKLTGVDAYVQSKIDAEALVRESAQPTVILRPSVILGDVRDGHISAFQGIHHVCGHIMRGTLPVLPADGSSIIDAVPYDLVTEAVRKLLDDGITQGEYWLTGGANAVTLQSMVDTSVAVAESLGYRVHPPRLLAREAVDRLLIPLMTEVLSPSQQRQMRGFVELMALFQSDTALPSDAGALGLAHLATSQVLLDSYRKANEYWAARNGLGAEAGAESQEAVA